MQVVWSPVALREIDRIFAYLVELHPRAAAAVCDALIEAADSLQTMPHRGRPVAKGGLRELVSGYPYVIRYRVFANEVRILRVRHTSRRPVRP